MAEYISHLFGWVLFVMIYNAILIFTGQSEKIWFDVFEVMKLSMLSCIMDAVITIKKKERDKHD